ncbi:hypothetical protein BDZ89DRAFT_1055823 [Hymenopellis radicata]|nr:hypothetical protein BDZ89DRAFT_1055823 [Hymenopellis radicata]
MKAPQNLRTVPIPHVNVFPQRRKRRFSEEHGVHKKARPNSQSDIDDMILEAAVQDSLRSREPTYPQLVNTYPPSAHPRPPNPHLYTRYHRRAIAIVRYMTQLRPLRHLSSPLLAKRPRYTLP